MAALGRFNHFTILRDLVHNVLGSLEVDDGILHGEHVHRIVPRLQTVTKGSPIGPCLVRVVRYLRCRSVDLVQIGKRTFVEQLPPRIACLCVDHIPDLVMGEGVGTVRLFTFGQQPHP